MSRPLRIDELPPLEADHVLAIQALARGTATGQQQVTAMWVLTGVLCGVASLPPAKLSEREAGFLAGKQWVGLALNKFASVDLYRAAEIK
jgi:hypothetical protein